MNHIRVTVLVTFGYLFSYTSNASAAPAGIPAGYVSTPGGWTHPSCIHEVPNNATIDTEHGNVIVNGNVIAHYDPCAYTPIPFNSPVAVGDASSASATSAAVPPSGPPSGPGYGGWVEDLEQDTSPSLDYDYLKSTIIVPSYAQRPPDDGETLYFFSSLQMSANNCIGGGGILQPVLQYGISPAGGYAYWFSVASWFWSWAGQYHGPLTLVTPGDQITGLISMTLGGTFRSWNVSAWNQNGTMLSQISPMSDCHFNRANAAVFEVDTLRPILNCGDVVRNYVDFTNIALYRGVYPNYTQENIVISPSTSFFPIGNNSPNCGWNIGSGLSYSNNSARLWATEGWTGTGTPTGCWYYSSHLNPGQVLVTGQQLTSCDGRFVLKMQPNGNLVLYSGSTQLWATNTSSGKVAIMQGDGNFVLYDGTVAGPYTIGNALWSSQTWGNPGAWLALQNDGNLVVYPAYGGAALWASNTCCH